MASKSSMFICIPLLAPKLAPAKEASRVYELAMSHSRHTTTRPVVSCTHTHTHTNVMAHSHKFHFTHTHTHMSLHMHTHMSLTAHTYTDGSADAQTQVTVAAD